MYECIQTPQDHHPPEEKKTRLEVIKHVTISIIKPQDMRYDTCGDWVVDGDTLKIEVAEGTDPRYAFAVALHEYIEATACLAANITQEQVDAFDIDGPGAVMDDPGRSRLAPYHKQHLLATALERTFTTHLGIDWKTYDKSIPEMTYGDETGNE